jgi:PKD repeat protein
MKKLIFSLITIALAFTACEPYYEPEAKFDVSNTLVSTYEDVIFYNNSLHANEYEWDFGDGTFSAEFEPVHNYAHSGVYEVRLSAYHNDIVSDTYMTIEVYNPASLDIQVLEYTDLYPVAGASVILYASFADWDKETNPIIEGTTNKNGIVFFDNLFPGYYYMDIWHPTHNNYDFANTPADVETFIKTPKAVGGTVTYFNAYVDYVGATKSASLRRLKKLDFKLKSAQTVNTTIRK